jgi:hypothetical protein
MVVRDVNEQMATLAAPLLHEGSPTQPSLGYGAVTMRVGSEVRTVSLALVLTLVGSACGSDQASDPIGSSGPTVHVVNWDALMGSLAFRSGDTIVVLRTKTRQLSVLPTTPHLLGPGPVALSPDGGRVAFAGGAGPPEYSNEIFVMKDSGSDLRAVSGNFCGSPGWSTDGAELFYLCGFDGSGTVIATAETSCMDHRGMICRAHARTAHHRGSRGDRPCP